MESEIAKLIERLERAEAPDENLDMDIARAMHVEFRNFTCSVDAVLAFADENLPGWYIDHAGDNAIGKAGSMTVTGHTVELGNEIGRVQGDAPIRAVAYCIAALKAVLMDRAERKKTLIDALLAGRVQEKVRTDIETVIGYTMSPFAIPEIEEDDGAIVLRWTSRYTTDTFSLTFLGEGNVSGYLSIEGCPFPAWKHPVTEAVKLTQLLNDELVHDVVLASSVPAP